MDKLDQKQLRELFDYDPFTGHLLWKKRIAISIKIGGLAGTVTAEGYRRIRLNGGHVYAHRIIFCWCNGYDPENQIDHINRNRDDNRIENLREISQSCNLRNCGISKNNKSGVTGIHWCRNSRRWEASIRTNGNRGYLGRYDNFDEAVLARIAGEQCLDWHPCQVSSPAYQYAIEHNLINRGG